GKENVVRELQSKGKTAMVGDGINDAPALTRADVGVAIGAGADVAVDAADVVLMKSRLADAVAAVRLSRATLKNIKENLFWAFIYNLVGIPLAAGVFIPVFGWKLTPMFGAAAMSLSSFCVVTNALRLNFFRLYGENENVIIEEIKKKEVRNMEKKMKIEGMTCGHCEARVKKVLEALPGVAAAKVSHETGTAVVTLNAEVADDSLKQVVEAEDYKVLSVG
ncbi:MAG: metal-transporting ATPase, partial [Schwartzia sp.]|nr:metal-transporting ATPase [Schwartzia sp. (in: firmicutes)]